MKKSLEIYQVDVFTDERFNGNPATVVWDSESLSKDLMLKLAQEFNNSETVFACFNKNNTLVLRYFTPTQEIDFCGHATIAAAIVFVKRLGSRSSIEFLTNSGPLTIHLKDGKYYYGPYEARTDEIIDGRMKEELLGVLNLSSKDLHSKYPMQIVKSVSNKLLIFLKTRKSVFGFFPNFTKLKEFSIHYNLPPVFLFSVKKDVTNLKCYGRMFAPTLGIDEDPVNGNSCITMAEYLFTHNVVEHTLFFNTPVQCIQGKLTGREGTVFIDVKEVNKQLKVSIGGTGVIVFKTKVKI
ncbi:PhzF family phenazine biosynthesis isomerase [Abyssalbus ytuae]|uniref:PhzF family phenazine biosynthesis isomerase n=1 Tax=Abyssalbus ytuae TaxID=2926907 RepID=A0A9E7CTH0_9FLAO|nr:PhzF family phenazine biosynthesis isomerase [Abyssalbus ytuae]UOB16152.1 PhzF family phenazine biosynthesis isomerase [Abyssalbus ytuae]